MQECDRCRDSYNDFLRLTQEQLPLLAAEEASAREPAGVFQNFAAKSYKARFAARAKERGIEIATARSPRPGAWSLSPSFSHKLGSAAIIAILVAMVGVASHRWKDAESRNAALSV